MLAGCSKPLELSDYCRMTRSPVGVIVCVFGSDTITTTEDQEVELAGTPISAASRASWLVWPAEAGTCFHVCDLTCLPFLSLSAV